MNDYMEATAKMDCHLDHWDPDLKIDFCISIQIKQSFENPHLLLLLQLADDILDPLHESLCLLGAIRGQRLVDLLRLVIEPLHLRGQLVRELDRTCVIVRPKAKHFLPYSVSFPERFHIIFCLTHFRQY